MSLASTTCLAMKPFARASAIAPAPIKPTFLPSILDGILSAQTRVKRTAELPRQELPPHKQGTITRVTLYDLRDGLAGTRSDKLMWFRSKPLQTILKSSIGHNFQSRAGCPKQGLLSMTQFAARVLFTKHVQKKRKTWQDGYLAVNSQDVNNRSGKLYDEEGKLVSISRIPASQIVEAASEGIL